MINAGMRKERVDGYLGKGNRPLKEEYLLYHQKKNRRAKMRTFRWGYKDLELILHPTLRIKGKEITWEIGGELPHLLCEMATLAQLIAAGLDTGEILFQKRMEIAGRKLIPDIFVPSKNLWMECLGCELEKLVYLRENFKGRVVWIREHESFLWDWEANFIDKFNFRLSNEEVKKQKKHHREKRFPLGIEVWAMLFKKYTARVLFAVRRDGEDAYTFYKSKEGWALSHLGYIRKRKDKIEELII